MAAVTRAASASLDANTGRISFQISTLLAGEDLDAVSACYIDDSDGLVYMATTADGLHGVNPVAVAEGQPVTLFGPGARYSYAAALTPGAPLYQSGATAGALDNATDGANDDPVAICVNETDIIITAVRFAGGGGS